MKRPHHSFHQSPLPGCSLLQAPTRTHHQAATQASHSHPLSRAIQPVPSSMEAEAFPIRFTRGVRAYWRRRKYHRLVEAADGGKATRQLGAPRRGGGWGAVRRLRVRVRVALAAPRRVLARARDASVGAMLALARRASALALPGGADGLWARRRKQLPAPRGDGAPTEFEQRLILEIYKSIVASKELTTMLHSSAAHLPPRAAAAPPMPAKHLLDM